MLLIQILAHSDVQPQGSPRSLLMSPGCRFPAGHMAAMDNPDLKEVPLTQATAFSKSIVPFLKNKNKCMKTSQTLHEYWHLSFEGENYVSEYSQFIFQNNLIKYEN